VTRYRCVDARKAEGFSVNAACDAVDVSTSGFYDWLARRDAPPTERELGEAELVAAMNEIFDDSDGNYGVPRMWKALRDRGLVVNRKRVRRLMRIHGMAGRHAGGCGPRFPARTSSSSPTWSAGASMPANLIGHGPKTSPTSRPVKGGCSWRRSSISDRGA
jgi:transposase